MLDSSMIPLINAWGIEEEQLYASEPNAAYQELLRLLSNKIYRLLQNDFEKLLQILYRIDLPEEEFKAALNLATLKDSALRLAERLIAREQQKIEFRKQYQQSIKKQF